MSTPATTTFVTAFIQVYASGQEYGNRTRAWRYEQFKVLAESGIPLCVYVNAAELADMTAFVAPYPHVRVMPPRELTETWSYQACQAVDGLRMPGEAHPTKDNLAYMQLILAKTEWLADAARQNPWGTSQFAWIDFSIAYVFGDRAACLAKLRRIAHAPMRRTRDVGDETCTMWIPGSYAYTKPITEAQIADPNSWELRTMLDYPYWRFCGGLAVGDTASVIAFDGLCRDRFPVFLATYQVILWEVNYWAWLETTARDAWTVRWYASDHNDTMILRFPLDDWCAPQVPARLLDAPGATTTTYPYPVLESNATEFVPSSAAYLYQPTTDTHWLLTRYVNYTQDERGCYHVRHPRRWLSTRNVLSRLDAATRLPLDHHEVSDPTDLPRNPAIDGDGNVYLGVEDIRLVLGAEGEVRYIGTTFEYANTNCLRMIAGVVDTQRYALVQNRIVDAPEWTSCEKNWTPVMGQIGTGTDSGNDGLAWVYKWGPTMQIGRIQQAETGTVDRLEIEQTHEVALGAPIFSKLRGSTVFHPMSDTECLGVLHYSHEGSPRKYYHVLVTLDRTTLRPLRYSDPFYFDRVGVEFCIGFAFRVRSGSETPEVVYDFWISRVDRDPVLVTVPIGAVPLVCEASLVP